MRYLLFLLLLISSVTYSQSNVDFRGDSARFYKNGGSMEVVIRNSTKDRTNGVLVNTGNGVTSFLKYLQLDSITAFRGRFDHQLVLPDDTLSYAPSSIFRTTTRLLAFAPNGNLYKLWNGVWSLVGAGDSANVQILGDSAIVVDDDTLIIRPIQFETDLAPEYAFQDGDTIRLYPRQYIQDSVLIRKSGDTLFFPNGDTVLLGTITTGYGLLGDGSVGNPARVDSATLRGDYIRNQYAARETKQAWINEFKSDSIHAPKITGSNYYQQLSFIDKNQFYGGNINLGYYGNSITGNGYVNSIFGGGYYGKENKIISDTSYNSIVGGYDNVINGGAFSMIAGGIEHRVGPSAFYAGIFGGRANIVDSGYWSSTIGGYDNRVYGLYSSVSGGNQNRIYTTARYGFIAASLTSKLGDAGSSAYNTAIIASNNCTVRNAGTAGIYASSNSIISGGTSAWGNYASIIGGANDTIGSVASTRFSTIIGGQKSAIYAGENCVVFGTQVKMNAPIGGAYAFTDGQTVDFVVTQGNSFNTRFQNGHYFTDGKVQVANAKVSGASNAQFEVITTTKGSIPNPVMTGTQRDAISSPASGLQVFNSTTNKPNWYNGTRWVDAGTSGTATLSAGTVTVSTTAVTAASKIYLTVNTPGGTQGFLSAPVASRTAGTSFVINSTSATETSTVDWLIVNY